MRAKVIGAALAGPTCAEVFRERGAEVAVLEASDSGRVRADEKLPENHLATPGLCGWKSAGEVSNA
jgi:flavin-dependent dehydrogenase